MAYKSKYIDDYIGMRFGSLVVVGYPATRDGIRRAGAICRCDCGNEQVVSSMTVLVNGKRTQCSECASKKMSQVLRDKAIAKGNPYLDYIHERLYKIWVGMKSRCENEKSKSYKYYGEKGVKVCDEWQDYLSFRKWAIDNGYDKNAPWGVCTIDRINPFGNYEPSNCRWADIQTQANNKRRDWLREHKDFTGERSA